MKAIRMAMLSAMLVLIPLLAQSVQPADGLRDAATALTRIMDAPERRIPEELIERARCLVIVPNLEVGPFVVGTKSGRGYLTCRDARWSGWSAPGVLRLEGGRVGFRIGGSSTDLVLLVMNGTVAGALLDAKLSLGPEGSVAAGPIGRELPRLTEEQSHADIFAWAHSGGMLTGLALNGVTLHQDVDGNERLYGRRLTTRDIVLSDAQPPDSASALIGVLNRYSRKDRTE